MNNTSNIAAMLADALDRQRANEILQLYLYSVVLKNGGEMVIPLPNMDELKDCGGITVTIRENDCLVKCVTAEQAQAHIEKLYSNQPVN